MTTNELPPIKLAFVIDGEVADILHTDERLSSIFLSNPLVLNVTEQLASESNIISVGSGYNAETGEFTAPVEPAPADTASGA